MNKLIRNILCAALFAAAVCAGIFIHAPAPAPAEAAANGKPLYVFNVIGDMQMGDPNIYDEENFKSALEQIKSISPESKAIISVGDHTNNGLEAQYKTLKQIKEGTLPGIPLYYAIGNHDRALHGGTAENKTEPSEWRNRFIKYAKESSGYDKIDNVYYSFVLEGSYVIMLGSEVTSRNDNCNDVFVSDEQYNWFEAEMKKAGNTGNPIYVIFHEPFKNTVSGSLPGQGWEGNPVNPNYYRGNRYADLKKVADKYPQTVVFSGHTHWSFTTKQPVLLTDGRTRATYMNCASVGYLWYDNLTGIKDRSGKWTGSEGLFVYVYSDRIEIKGRDFINNKWILNVTVPVGQGVSEATKAPASAPTKAPTQAPVPDETLAPANTSAPAPTAMPTQNQTAETNQPTAETNQSTSGNATASAAISSPAADSVESPAVSDASADITVSASVPPASASASAAASGKSGSGGNTALKIAAALISAAAVAAALAAGIMLYKNKKK